MVWDFYCYERINIAGKAAQRIIYNNMGDKQYRVKESLLPFYGFKKYNAQVWIRGIVLPCLHIIFTIPVDVKSKQYLPTLADIRGY